MSDGFVEVCIIVGVWCQVEFDGQVVGVDEDVVQVWGLQDCFGVGVVFVGFDYGQGQDGGVGVGEVVCIVIQEVVCWFIVVFVMW